MAKKTTPAPTAGVRLETGPERSEPVAAPPFDGGAEWYHVWLEPGCVRSNVTLAGVSFPKRTRVRIDDGQSAAWSERHGTYTRLTPEQLDRVAEALAGRVQRVRNEEAGTGDIYMISHPNYKPARNDEPLEHYAKLRHAPDGPPQIKPRPDLASDLQARLDAARARMDASQRQIMERAIERTATRNRALKAAGARL